MTATVLIRWQRQTEIEQRQKLVRALLTPLNGKMETRYTALQKQADMLTSDIEVASHVQSCPDTVRRR